MEIEFDAKITDIHFAIQFIFDFVSLLVLSSSKLLKESLRTMNRFLIMTLHKALSTAAVTFNIVKVLWILTCYT